MGDPGGEEQGLNSVFDSDESTWKVIEKYAGKLKQRKGESEKQKALNKKQGSKSFQLLAKITSTPYPFSHGRFYTPGSKKTGT